MKKNGYKKKIIENMELIGTYKPEFDRTIELLAEMYADMDTARKQFEKGESSLGQFVVGDKRNPYYMTIEKLRADILLYNRELGLTAAGLKKLREKCLEVKSTSKLESALENLMDEAS